MGKEKYIITTKINGETYVYERKYGEVIRLENSKINIIVGVTKSEELPKFMTIEPKTKDNKYKLKLAKKLKK